MIVDKYAVVKIHQIVFNRLNRYGILKKEERLQWLTDILHVSKQFLNPPIVSVRPDGTYLCVAGEGRIIAAERAGMESILVHTIEGLSEEEAMAVLAEDNATQRVDVYPARANEAYFLWKAAAKRTRDLDYATRYVGATYIAPNTAWQGYVLPGWFIAHSKFMDQLMERGGPRRENLADIEFERQQLINMRQFALKLLASPLQPLSPEELLHPPHPDDLAIFDDLLSTFVYRELSELTATELQRALRRELREATLKRAEHLAQRGEAGAQAIRTLARRHYLSGRDRRSLERLAREAIRSGAGAQAQTVTA